MSSEQFVTIRITREAHAALAAYASKEGTTISKIADKWLIKEIDRNAPGLRDAVSKMTGKPGKKAREKTTLPETSQ